MDFVHQINLAVSFAELIFCINQNESSFRCDFCAAAEERESVFFQKCVFLGSREPSLEDFFF